jgi:penicillin V acylase-like amidase (Ntn superfamily)
MSAQSTASQRAAYFSALLPEPETERQAVAALIAIMRNVSVPFGVPDQDFGVYSTEYRTVSDLTHLTYYFELTTSPNVVWVEFSDLDLARPQVHRLGAKHVVV